jgi:hypothetical protein
MTPKEKAKDLIAKFYFGTSLNDMKEVEKCASIAVDEILNAVTTIADKKYDYFLEVKKQIEEL